MNGENHGGVEFNFSGAFLLWRGAAMKQEWISPYEDVVGGRAVRLPGNTSTSRSPMVALGFALDKEKEGHEAVLFVILCRNYFYPEGI